MFQQETYSVESSMETHSVKHGGLEGSVVGHHQRAKCILTVPQVSSSRPLSPLFFSKALEPRLPPVAGRRHCSLLLYLMMGL